MRKIEDERDARRCLKAAAAAGLSVAAWARAHGVDGRSLGVVTYDSVYGQLPVSETATVSTSGVTTLSTTVPMTGTPGWDRGTGGVRRVVDPNGFETTVTYDGFGRLTSTTPPAVGACASHPATVITYEITTDGLVRPASRVLTTSYLGAHDDPTSLCAADGDVIETVGFMDGLGRPRASLATADYTGQWIRSGVSVLNKKGEVRYAFQPVYHWGSATDFVAALAVPPTTVEGNRIYTATTYDAFGRAVGVQDESGNSTTTNFHAASQDVCDPNDNDDGSPFAHTCTTVRVDGHGREIDQILRQRTGAGDEQHRLWTYYRDDGAVLALVRARSEEGIRPAYSSIAGSSDPHVVRVFTYDNQGRRLSSNDPDTDARGAPTARRSWRYAFNRIGDLVAVRDPRGCGQNFFYDLGGRLLGEQYVSCEEGYTSRPEQPNEVVPSGSLGMSMLGASATVDVRYSYDAFPSWVPSGTLPGGSHVHLGRATGVADRGQRSAVLYDSRGQAVWTGRQMALLGDLIPMPTDTSAPTPSGVVSYDDTHTYVRTSTYDQGGRVRSIALPRDPDYDASESGSARLGPTMGAEMRFDHRGLPERATAVLGATSFDVVSNITYDRDGAVLTVEYGGEGELTTTTWYDERRRPTRSQTHRERRSGTTAGTIEHVETITDQILGWDAASNLTQLVDARDATEWPSGHRPRTLQMSHDALYHVTGATAWYLDPDDTGVDAAGDWRTEAAATNAADPMHIEPAPMVSELPEERFNTLAWRYDYLGNSTLWNDDATNFYERSLGAITNGNDLNGDHTDASSNARPSALNLASNLEMATPGPLPEGRGYVEVDYGVSGNVVGMTVYGECSHVTGTSCYDNTSLSFEARRDWLAENCSCERAQHYQYLYDELNRMAEARRFDRATPTGAFDVEVRQRYRYDSANQRTVKATYDVDTDQERIALYVYPGDFERRGLTRGLTTYDADTSGTDTTETQYVLAGGRVVFDEGADLTGTLNRNDRITVGVTDLIQTTGAVVDLVSGELIEVSTYYPNGARENLWTSSANVPLEPNGFTGKEADEEVGLTYFGERYLISRIGRWATPDPLHVHANGGGEALNSYHYVSGNLLQARDPLGLDATVEEAPESAQAEGVEAGYYIEGDDGTTLYARNQAGYIMQPPAACGSQSPECLQQFWEQANRLNAIVSIWRPDGADDVDGVDPTSGCTSGLICDSDGGENGLDNTVSTVAALTGDNLGTQGCQGRCTGGVPGGTGEDAAPGQQILYLVSVALSTATAAVGAMVSGRQASDAAEEVVEEVAEEVTDIAANRALHERYVDELRAAMERPAVRDESLSRIVDQQYRPNATVGSGSTAAAVRYEASTGLQVGGRSHTQKARDSIVLLRRWLDRNPTARPGDRAAAENVLRDLQNALGGN